MTATRIAIIGGGVGGLATAWSLQRSGIEVAIYEKDTTAGGHCRTIVATHGEERLTVDPGVQVFCPPIYPHVVALCRLLGVRMIPFPVGFTVKDGERGPSGTSLHDTDWWREVEQDCVRFTVEMSELMSLRAAEIVSLSIGEYLSAHGYGETFIQFMASVASIIGPQKVEDALETSIVVFASVLSSGFLSLLSPSSHEMAFEGGVASFVRALSGPVAHTLRLKTGVAHVRRDASGVTIVDEHGHEERFEQVVFCVDGLLALALLDDPSPEEETLLGGCQLKAYASMLHDDASVLVPGLEAHRRTYIEINDGLMSLNMGVLNLEKRPLQAPFILSYEILPLDGGPAESPARLDPQRVTARHEFRQTKDNTYAFEVKKNLHRIQGQRRSWFVGAWTTMSTLEHTVVSGLVVAEALGAAYPFAHDLKAARGYSAIKSLMLQGTEDFPLSAL